MSHILKNLSRFALVGYSQVKRPLWILQFLSFHETSLYPTFDITKSIHVHGMTRLSLIFKHKLNVFQCIEAHAQTGFPSDKATVAQFVPYEQIVHIMLNCHNTSRIHCKTKRNRCNKCLTTTAIICCDMFAFTCMLSRTTHLTTSNTINARGLLFIERRKMFAVLSIYCFHLNNN